MVQTSATSTEDLTKVPSWKKLSPQARLSALLDKTNHQASPSSLSSNGTSASLIDLTSIDKLPTNIAVPPTAARPRFRFVPSSDQNSVLKEEPELEQQPPASVPAPTQHQAYDNFNVKTVLTSRVPSNAPKTSSKTVSF